MHNKQLSHNLAIVKLIQDHRNNHQMRILKNDTLHLRLEAFGATDKAASCFAVYDSHSEQLNSLLTTDATVLRRYTQLAKKLPVHERHALGLAGILLNSLIERGKYEAKPDENNTIIRDFYAFVKWIANAEYDLYTSHQVDISSLNANSLEGYRQLQHFKTNSFGDASIATNPQYFSLLNEACETFLKEFADKHSNKATWNDDWRIIVDQIGVDLVAFSTMAPLTAIPKSQMHWITQLVDTETAAVDNGFITYLLCQNPTTEETNCFLKACAINTLINQEQPYFIPTLAAQVIMLGARTAATPIDFIQLVWNLLPKLPKTTYLSTRLEGHLLGYEQLGGPQIIPENSIIKHSIQPVSASLLRKITEIQLRDTLKHIGHVSQTALYSILAAPMHLLQVTRDIEAELKAGKTFEDALTNERLSQMAKTLRQHIEDTHRAIQDAYGDVDSLSKERFEERIESAEREKSGLDLFNELCKIYREVCSNEAIQNRNQAMHMEEWESGKLTMVTSFFPSLLTHELVTFANNSFVQQHYSTLAAATIAMLGVLGTPYLYSVVNQINLALAGKTFETLAPGEFLNPIMMGYSAFQACMLVTSLYHRNDSLLMSLVKILAQDPLKAVTAVAVALGGAKLLMSEFMINAVQTASCQFKFSKTALLWMPELCIAELVETLQLASIPQPMQMLVMYKIFMYLRTLLSLNRHATPTLASLMQSSALSNKDLKTTSMNEKLLQMITWNDLSDARDFVGRAQTGAFISVMKSLDTAVADKDEKQAIMAQLYRHYMQSPKPVFVDFMQQVMSGLAFSGAYTLRALPLNYNYEKGKVEIRWNLWDHQALTSLSSYLQASGEALKWITNAFFQTVFAWWLFQYHKERDGSIFSAIISLIMQRKSHAAHHEECPSHAMCLDTHNPLLHSNHTLLHDLVEKCMATITSCNCVEEGATQDALNSMFYALKILTVIFVGLSALQYWVRWNNPLTQQARHQTKEYWKGLGSSLMSIPADLSFLVLFVVVMYGRALANASSAVYGLCGNSYTSQSLTKSPDGVNTTPFSESTHEFEFHPSASALSLDQMAEDDKDASSSASVIAHAQSKFCRLFGTIKKSLSDVADRPTVYARPLTNILVNRLFRETYLPNLSDLVVESGNLNGNTDAVPAV